MKHLNEWKMSKKINNPGFKIYVKRFVVAKATFMKYHIHPLLRNAPKHLIFYVGTSDLDPDKTGESIVNTSNDFAAYLEKYKMT